MNRTTTTGLAFLLLITLFTINTQPSKAEPKILIVPDNYPTITAAIDHAADGDTIFVKKGTYVEHSLAINKTISLTGEDKNSTIIKNIDNPQWNPLNPFPPPTPIAIQINANNVNVSGFTITFEYGWWIPIRVDANQVQITENIMNRSDGIIINGNYNIITQNSFPSGLRNSLISCVGSYNLIMNNSMSGIVSGGISIAGASNIVQENSLTNCTMFGSITANGDKNLIAKNNLTNSGDIRIENGSNNTICANYINGNGIFVIGNNNTVYSNYVTQGISLGNAALGAIGNTFYHNNFVSSTQITIVHDVREVNFWDNGSEGNYWSSYNGTDANGDGIGDTPHRISQYAQDNYPLMTPFNISTTTIQLPEWATITPTPLPTPTITQPPTPTTPTPTQSPTQSPNPTSTIPEHPAWIILPLALIATASIIAIKKKTGRV